MSAPDQIEIKLRLFDGGVVVQPVGDIDLSRSPLLRQEIAQVQSKRPKKLIVDLSEVPYMDSSGVATLVEAMQNARRNGSRLILCGLREKVQSIFEIARLHTVFTICADTDAATGA
jgi:anti-sigma B factor antagonist